MPERSTDGGFTRLISHAEREEYEREHLDGNCIFKYSVRIVLAVVLIALHCRRTFRASASSRRNGTAVDLLRQLPQLALIL